MLKRVTLIFLIGVVALAIFFGAWAVAYPWMVEFDGDRATELVLLKGC
jgi:hypothetical protein